MNADERGSLMRLQAQDDAADLETRSSENEQKAHMKTGCAQVVDALSLMYAIKGACGLELDHDRVSDDKIGKISSDDLIAKEHIHRVLLLNRQASSFNFDSKCVFIDLLQEAAAEDRAHTMCRSYDLRSDDVDPVLITICVHLRSSAAPLICS